MPRTFELISDTSRLPPSTCHLPPSQLVHVFRGSLESHLTCTACGDSRVRAESFLDLSLSLSLSKSGLRNACLSKATSYSNPALVSGSGPSGPQSALFEDVGEAKTPELALYDCLRSFTALEMLGERVVRLDRAHCLSCLYHVTRSYLLAKLPLQLCERCGDNQPTHKQLFIATPPNVLVIHLKRFDMLTKKKVRHSA